MLRPCPACHDTKRVRILMQDAQGNPYRSDQTRPCTLCTVPVPFRPTVPPRIIATTAYYVAGERERDQEDEERCDCPPVAHQTYQGGRDAPQC